MNSVDREEFRSTVEGALAAPFIVLVCYLMLAACSPTATSGGAEASGVYTGTAARSYAWEDGTVSRAEGASEVIVTAAGVELWRGCVVPTSPSVVGYTIGRASCDYDGRRTDHIESGLAVVENGTIHLTMTGTSFVGTRVGRFTHAFNGQK